MAGTRGVREGADTWEYQQPTNWNINSEEGQQTLDTMDADEKDTGEIQMPVLLTDAFYQFKKEVTFRISGGNGVHTKESDKRMVVMGEEGINIQGTMKKYWLWKEFIKDVTFIENVEKELMEVSFIAPVGIHEGKAVISERDFETFIDNYERSTWGFLQGEVGRWERMQDGWNDFWEETGELVGGAVSGASSGIFSSIGGGKILLVAGLIIVGLVLFVSSDRGTKTASNVGTATGGVKS